MPEHLHLDKLECEEKKDELVQIYPPESKDCTLFDGRRFVGCGLVCLYPDYLCHHADLYAHAYEHTYSHAYTYAYTYSHAYSYADSHTHALA